MAKTNQDQDVEAGHHKGGTSFYYVIAFVLMAITYLEFAIVEYDVAWLNGFATLVLLVGMSLLKFALVIAIYMHLRDDDPIYTGFFSSGIVIAMGTFIALSFLFTARGMIAASSAQTQAALAESVIEGEAMHERGLEELELLLAEERPLLESYRVPKPKQQGVLIPLPEAPAPVYSLRAVAPSSPAP